MIRAEHRKWASAIFFPYMNRLLKKDFSAFYLVNEFPSIPEHHSLLLTSNHISWWDGFFNKFLVSRFTNRKVHLMMHEEQLKRYWFFNKLGAYSINPGYPDSIRQSSEYTREILKYPGNYTIVFPQGEIEDFQKYPLSIKKGLAFFVHQVTNCSVLPVAFKIQYYEKKYPAVIARFGNVKGSEDMVKDFEKYKNDFHINVSLLQQASCSRKFSKDLFKT